MNKQSKLIEELIKHINTFTTCYYEQVPTSANYPFSVIMPPSTSELDAGNLVMFDIEIYANELTGAEDIESLCDTLRNNLDNYLLISENNFNAHIEFNNYSNMRENEQDLLARRITFEARVFYI